MMERMKYALLLCAAILAAGCGRGEDEPTEKLVVYTYDAFGDTLQTAVVEHFRATYDVAVRFERFEDTGGLFNQVYLERKRPRGDVVIGLDTTYLTRVYADDLLVAYEPPGLTLVSDALIVDPEYRAVPFDYGGVLLNYDSEALSDPPGTWEELLDPRLKDAIIVMNPATSSPGRNFLLLTVEQFGEEGFLDFWRRLKPNVLTVTGGWSDGYGLYTQGEAPIVLSYDTSPAYHREFEDTTRYRNLVIADVAYAQVEVAGIIRGSANTANARRLMDYIVSPPFQQLIPLSQFMYPIHPEAELPASFAAGRRAGTLVTLDEGMIADRLADWIKDWEEVMR